MGEIKVAKEGVVGAPPELVYGLVADMREHHPRFLPPAFSDLVVEEGGVGAGTVYRFKLKVGGRTREAHMRVDEPEPGRVLTESEIDSSLITTWTFSPDADGSRVRIATKWDGAGGIGGVFERLFAPRMLARLYADELQRLDRYARERARATA
jgi:hypothetical protein